MKKFFICCLLLILVIAFPPLLNPSFAKEAYEEDFEDEDDSNIDDLNSLEENDSDFFYEEESKDINKSTKNNKKIKLEKKMTCYNRVLKCLRGGIPACTSRERDPVCLGSEISCCKNEDGELDCVNYGEGISSHEDIYCEQDKSKQEFSDSYVLGDFNNDKKDDIAFKNTNTGVWDVAFITENSNFENKRFGSWSVHAEWSNIHSGDFDGDRFKDDIVGRNISTNEIWLSSSDKTKFKNTKSGSLTKGEWTHSGVGDFNNDKKDDLIFIDPSSNNIVVGFSVDKSFENSVLGKNEIGLIDFFTVLDLDGDGFNDDVIILNKSKNTLVVYACENKIFKIKTFMIPGLKELDSFYAIDFDNTKTCELFGFTKENGNWYQIILGEKPLLQKIGSWGNKEKLDEVLWGNFNADENKEILSRIKYDRFGWLLVSEFKKGMLENKFYATPSIDLTGQMNLDNLWKWSPNVGLNNILVGDFNGDGKSDLAGKIPYYSKWFCLEVSNEKEERLPE